MFTLPIFMSRFKRIIFVYQTSPKIKLFLQKDAKCLYAGGVAPRPPCLLKLGALGAPPPDPQNSPPLRISG